MKFLAVTACPSGVAHTYMSAEALEKAAKKHGIEIKVETQGSIGIENQITPEDLAGTDAVILTKDMPIKDEEYPESSGGSQRRCKESRGDYYKVGKDGEGTLKENRGGLKKPLFSDYVLKNNKK